MDMHAEFKTIITHKVKIGDDGIADLEHDVAVEAGTFGGIVGKRLVQAIVRQGCEGAIKAIDDGEAEMVVTTVTDEEADGPN